MSLGRVLLLNTVFSTNTTNSWTAFHGRKWLQACRGQLGSLLFRLFPRVSREDFSTFVLFSLLLFPLFLPFLPFLLFPFFPPLFLLLLFPLSHLFSPFFFFEPPSDIPDGARLPHAFSPVECPREGLSMTWQRWTTTTRRTTMSKTAPTLTSSPQWRGEHIISCHAEYSLVSCA